MSLTYNKRSNPLLSCVGNLPGGGIYVYRQERKSQDQIPIQISAPIQEHIDKLQDLSGYQKNVIPALNAELCSSNYGGELITYDEAGNWDVNAILRTLYRQFSNEQVHTLLIKIQREPDIFDDGDSGWFIGETQFEIESPSE